jgi:hypothetical protein
MLSFLNNQMPPRLNGARPWIGAIEVELTGIKEGPFVPHIADLQRIVPAQLPRDLHVPVLEVAN